jgi:hypothetical protein
MSTRRGFVQALTWGLTAAPALAAATVQPPRRRYIVVDDGLNSFRPGIEIWLDGVKVDHVVEADEAAGWVMAVLDFRRDDGTERLDGDVEIRRPAGDPEEWQRRIRQAPEVSARLRAARRARSGRSA